MFALPVRVVGIHGWPSMHAARKHALLATTWRPRSLSTRFRSGRAGRDGGASDRAAADRFACNALDRSRAEEMGPTAVRLVGQPFKAQRDQRSGC